MKNIKSRLWKLSLALCAGIVFPAISIALQDGIVLDPSTGNYTIYYGGNQVVFVPATKVDPVIKSEFKEAENGTITYQYKIKNGRLAKQALVGMRMSVSSALNGSQATPKDWKGLAEPNITTNTGFTISWLDWHDDNVAADLLPGKTRHGFSIGSKDLPSVVKAEFWGDTMAPGFPDEGPDPNSEVGKQFEQLNNNDFVHRYAVAPLVAVPTPFNAAAVLTAIQHHIDRDLVAMKLIDPVFAAQLDRLLQAAIAAVNIGNTKAAREDLNELHRLIESEHKNIDKDDDKGDRDKDKDKSRLIDKLAARVLVFDLRYVAKRLEGKDKDD